LNDSDWWVNSRTTWSGSMGEFYRCGNGSLDM
jgi:hypothetical protein